MKMSTTCIHLRSLRRMSSTVILPSLPSRKYGTVVSSVPAHLAASVCGHAKAHMSHPQGDLFSYIIFFSPGVKSVFFWVIAERHSFLSVIPPVGHAFLHLPQCSGFGCLSRRYCKSFRIEHISVGYNFTEHNE